MEGYAENKFRFQIPSRYRCGRAVATRGEFADSLVSQRRHLQTVVLYVMLADVRDRFFNARGTKPAGIHRQICDVYGEEVMSELNGTEMGTTF